MSGGAAVTFVVRTRDSAATLGAAFASIRGQSVPAEIVVVDSGSTDGTLELAHDAADVVLQIPSSQFSYGGTLNMGAAAARTEVVAALSSHCALPSPEWAATAVRHIGLGAVGAWGSLDRPDGTALEGPLRLTHGDLTACRGWGFSNHASAWSRAAWQEHPFDEAMPASEDKEWTWRATLDGRHVVADPALFVPGLHRRSKGAAAYFRRLVVEATSLHPWLPMDHYPLSRALSDWAVAEPHGFGLTQAQRFGRTRAIEVAARWHVAREVRR